MTEKPEKYLVYLHEDPDSGKKYYGLTKQDTGKRWQKGIGYKYKNPEFYEHLQERGWDNFLHKIIRKNLTRDQACELEYKLIKKYDTMNPDKGFNLRTGGESNLPGVSVRKHISESLMGHEVPEYVREKLRDSVPSRSVNKLSLEGKKLHTYKSLSEAARATGATKANIWSAITGRKHTAGGYRWEYA